MNQPLSTESDIVQQIQGTLFPEDEPVEQEAAPEAELEEKAEEPIEEEEQEQEEEVVEAASEEEESLAAALGLEEGQADYDEEGNILVRTKVGDEEAQVTLKELVKGYQLEKYTTKKSMELAEQQRQLDTEYTTQVSELKQKLEVAESLVGSMKQSLKDEFNSIDWEQLKQVDPGRYVELRENFSKRASHFSGVEAKLSEEQQLQKDAFEQKQMQEYERFIKGQMDQLIAHYPDLQNEEVRGKELGKLSNFMVEQYGYTPEETNGVIDHRLVRVLFDAYKYNNAQQTAKAKLEKPAIPAFKKPSRRGGDTTKARAVKSKLDKLRKTGSANDLAAILVDRM